MSPPQPPSTQVAKLPPAGKVTLAKKSPPRRRTPSKRSS
jgi:hypothetical protein